MSDRHSATGGTELPSRNEDAGEVVQIRSHSGDALFNINYLFDSERQQMLFNTRNLDRHTPFRQDFINWILERHRHFRFSPATAHRALAYFDWFLSIYIVPEVPAAWRYRLLATTCLSVAAKEEEPRAGFPSAVDLQGRPGRSFSARTIRNMESVVVARLQMRLGSVTPVDFRDYFISRLPPSPVPRPAVHIAVTFSFLVMNTIRAGDFRRFFPSEVAAAAVILAAGLRNVELPDAFYERVHRVRVTSCRQQLEGYLTVFCPCSDCAGRSRRLLDATLFTTGGGEHSGAGEDDMPEGPVRSGDALRNPDA